VKIAEVIAALEELAEQLPQGRDTAVQVHICNGDAPAVMTPSIEVQFMQLVNTNTGEVGDTFVVVQGHPHRDAGGGVSRPVTLDLEQTVAQWSADFAEHGRSRPEPAFEFTTDPDTGTRFVLVQNGPGRWVRLELGDDGFRYRPGAPDAVAAGCTCDPVKNNHGRGTPGDDGVLFIFRQTCPVHLEVDAPGAAE
jgi:hypothetical protein